MYRLMICAALLMGACVSDTPSDTAEVPEHWYQTVTRAGDTAYLQFFPEGHPHDAGKFRVTPSPSLDGFEATVNDQPMDILIAGVWKDSQYAGEICASLNLYRAAYGEHVWSCGIEQRGTGLYARSGGFGWGGDLMWERVPDPR